MAPPSQQYDVYVLIGTAQADGTTTYAKGDRIASAADLGNAVALMGVWFVAKQNYNPDPNLLLGCFETATDAPKAYVEG
jgi:hypothetical protein